MRFVPRRAAAVVVVGLLATPSLLPLLTAVLAWATPAGEVWQHQLQYVLPRVAWNTTLLLLIVGSATALLGTGLAWLVAGHDFPGRSVFTWALLLPLAVPGYVLAVVFAGALDYAGPLQSWLRAATQVPLRLPPIRSLGGAALVLTLCLYPYVYMLARVAFESAGARALEAAQSLGLDRRAAFRKVLLPLARPAVAAGVGLVCMETLSDFGVVAALNVDTFTTAIYRAWFGMFSISAALQMAALLGLLALAGVWLERRSRGGRGFATQRAERRPAAAAAARRARPGRHGGCDAGADAGVRAADGAVARLGDCTRRDGSRRALLGFRRAQRRRCRVRGARRRHGRAGPRLRVAARRPPVGARPRPFRHRRLRDSGHCARGGPVRAGGCAGRLADSPASRACSGPRRRNSSCRARCSPCSSPTSRASSPSAPGPSRAGSTGSTITSTRPRANLGVRGVARLRRVHLPLLRGSLLAAAVLVFVDLMKELPITLMTRPFGFETLAVRVFEMAAEGEWQRAALPSVLIVAAGVLPVVLLARRVTHVA